MKQLFTIKSIWALLVMSTLIFTTGCRKNDPTPPDPDKPNQENPDEPDKPNPDEPENKPKETITIQVGDVAMEFILVQGGSFMMGSEDGRDNEKPVHKVTLSDYYIGKTEVTQALWQTVMDANPSYTKGDNLPVESISWNDIRKFIAALNDKTGQKFRLPTEAEWEFAARGGNKSKGFKYAGSDDLDAAAWYQTNAVGASHPVATKEPNELGIYDMSGNVWEWCSDWYDVFTDTEETDPIGPGRGSAKLFRGGSWDCEPIYCRSTNRSKCNPAEAYYDLGCRLVLLPTVE